MRYLATTCVAFVGLLGVVGMTPVAEDGSSLTMTPLVVEDVSVLYESPFNDRVSDGSRRATCNFNCCNCWDHNDPPPPYDGYHVDDTDNPDLDVWSGPLEVKKGETWHPLPFGAPGDCAWEHDWPCIAEEQNQILGLGQVEVALEGADAMEWFAVVEAGGGALSVHEDRNMLQWRDCGGAVVASFSLTAEQKEIVYYARSLIVDPLQ